MPLVIFSINPQYLDSGDHIPLGMERDGSFRLRHVFKHLPPPETVFTLKHVTIDGGGYASRSVGGGGGGKDNSINKKPTAWMSVDFPQLTEGIIASREHTETIIEQNSREQYSNDRGILRFPITTYPVTGINFSKSGRPENNSNEANRFAFTDSISGRKYEHKGNHSPNIKLGSFNLEEGFIDCILTPRDVDVRTSAYTRAADRTCRIARSQVILEYK